MKGSLGRSLLMRVVYPAFTVAGIFAKKKKERLQDLFIRMNNRLVLRESPRVGRLLLLLPHCLQIDECKIRLTHNIRNCQQCGKCGIKDLIGIADRDNIELHVATGGNLARRIVSNVNPDAVVAVACERDLSSGIVDTYPLPVLGITNQRPFGPCINTTVDMKAVEEAIAVLVRGGG